ncbi:hypothetical protein QTG54_004266 [Skeletonema marinoi]|uniref:Uncharacterized protein n=1 Tax=Skeletonema marinoi TaxID=267567 RepID=A0AAD9DGG9_9STRA|nr:hypothetical protein QTG54_004266 [Skeletonema marinoi]
MMTTKNVGPPFEELHLSNLPSEEHNIESSESINTVVNCINLYDNTVLTSLNLRGCGISHAGATKISCALASNASITVLDLSNNRSATQESALLIGT